MTEAPPAPRLAIRPHDWAIAGAVTLLYAIFWAFLPSEWTKVHTGGKWLLSVFVLTSGAAALLASVFFTTPGVRARDNPAAWLGVQVVFWNPIAFRAVVAAVQGVGLPAAYASVAAIAGLLVLGLPTSLLGGALCRSPSWIATYACRALQCFFATWFPLVPPLAFLHVVVIAQAVTWDRYSRLHRMAVMLVCVEQTLALVWFFLFYRVE